MKFNKAHKLELCVSKDETRVAMAHVHFDKEAKVMVSTDGHRMIVVPVEDCDDDTGGFLTVDMLKSSRKAAGKGTDALLKANGVLTVPATGEQRPRPGDDIGTFPNWRQVVPDKDAPLMISFNAKYLKEIADAIGAEDGAVVLAFQGSLDPILVFNSVKEGREIHALRGERDPYGVLMPIRCNDIDKK